MVVAAVHSVRRFSGSNLLRAARCPSRFVAMPRRESGGSSPLLGTSSPTGASAHAAPSPSAGTPQQALDKSQYTLAGLGLVGLALWWCPHPASISSQAWHLLVIFVTAITGIVLQPLPTGAIAALAAATAMLTRTLTFDAAFKAFSAEVPWLIAIAMFLAEAVTSTGLGARLAYHLVAALGSSPLGLAYALVAADACMAPAIPSVAARAGGIVLPLVKGLCSASGSSPRDGTANVLGAYLMVTMFQAAAVSSALFLTSNHPNPLSAKLAEDGIGQAITWGGWARASIVPGAVSLAAIPLVTMALVPPTMKNSASAQRIAREKLQSMGPLSRKEGIVTLTMVVTVVLWMFGHTLALSNVAVALGGLSVLLVTKVLSWSECLKLSHAWDTMWWFAIVIALASQLKQLGLIALFSDEVAKGVGALGLGWQPSFLVLLLVYFYSHYFFASNVAHVTAMYSAFLAVMVASGTPGMLAALVLAFVSNFMGGLGTWTMSHAPMFYGEHYVSQAQWLKSALITSVVNLLIWLMVGGVWWKAIGLW